jgi:pheromone shutdown-related protein TraB
LLIIFFSLPSAGFVIFGGNDLENSDIHRLNIDGKEIILIGTAHVSPESVALVETVILSEKPDTVCIELCQSRFDAIKQKDKWRETDIIKVIREKRAPLLLSQLLMAAFQKKLAQKFNINPGEEMRRAAQTAEQIGAGIVLADRDIRTTLLRAWRKMKFWQKIKLIPESIASVVLSSEISEEEIEKLKKQDALALALEAFGEKLPAIKSTLIDERDQYLAGKISEAPGKKIVAVVGAGHVPGIKHHLGEKINFAALEEVPEKGPWGSVISWGMCIAMLGMFVGGFFYSGNQAGVDMLKWWSLITAASASVGALILLAHPLTIAASAIAAPIATIHPLIATGWVAGLVEATLRKPQVKDFLDLPSDIGSVRGFWKNKITRILLIIAIVNLTASIGVLVAVPVVVRLLH